MMNSNLADACYEQRKNCNASDMLKAKLQNAFFSSQTFSCLQIMKVFINVN